MKILITILIILLVFYGLKLLFRLALPFMLNYVSKKAQNHFESSFSEAFGESPFQANKTKDKETFKSSSNKTKEVVGEYVDFEEIE
jgi:hypothetical protein